jgi:HEAT repeat protein
VGPPACRPWWPRVLATLSLILAFVALPLSIGLANAWLGIMAAALGVLVAARACWQAVRRRAPGAWTALLGLGANALVLASAIALAGGPEFLHRPVRDALSRVRETFMAGRTEPSEGAPAASTRPTVPDHSVTPPPEPALLMRPVEAPRPPPEPVTPPEEVAQLLAPLRKQGNEAGRVRAANQLGALGATARPATRALCEAALVPSDPLREACLDALEKIHPALAKQVLALLVDADSAHHIRASEALGKMKAEAEGAVPVLVAHLNWSVSSEGPEKAPFKAPFSSPQAVLADIEALVKIAPGDRETVTALCDLLTRSVVNGGPAGKRFVEPRLREQAVQALGGIGSSMPDKRKQIVPALAAALRLTQASDFLERRAAVAALDILGSFGADARTAQQAIRRLRFDQDSTVRDAANAALAKIGK